MKAILTTKHETHMNTSPYLVVLLPGEDVFFVTNGFHFR